MSRTKRALLVLLGFGFGATAGAIATAHVFYDVERARDELSRMFQIQAESKQATEQYRSGSPEVAMYALAHYVDVLKRYRAEEISSGLKSRDSILLLDLGLAYARIGVVAEKSGQTERAQKAYSEGVAAFESAQGKIRSVDELRRWVKRLDENGAKPLRMPADPHAPSPKVPW